MQPYLSHEDFLDSEAYAQYLLEQGDLGIPPNVTRASYPRVNGDGPFANLWRATAGATYDDHMAAYYGHTIKPETEPPPKTRKRQGVSSSTKSHHFLTGEQAERLFNSAAFCIAGHGKTFDLHGSVSWQYAGITDPIKAAAIFTKLNNRLTKRLNRNFGMNRLSVYAHESGHTHGFHTHFLLHTGEAWADLQSWLPKNLESLCKQPLAENALHLVHRTNHRQRNKIFLHWAWLRYLLKGIPPDLMVRDMDDKRRLKPVRNIFRLRPRPAGFVPCRRRAGVSEALSKTAQAEAGFVSPFTQGRDEWVFSETEFVQFWNGLARKAKEDQERAAVISLLDWM